MFDEEQYQASKWSLWAGGQALKGTITGISSALLTIAAGTAGLALPGILAFGAIGTLGIVVGAVLNKRILNLEHDREEHRILSFYRKEVAAQTGQVANEVTIDDLRLAAAKNETLAEALKRNDEKVNSRMRAWVAGAILATIVLGVLFAPGFGLLAATVNFAGGGIPAMIGGAAVRGLFGALTFNLARPILDVFSDKFSGIAKHTSHDYIKELREIHDQGQQLSPQQVMEAFVKANPDIEAGIEQKYGKSFDAIVKKDHRGTLQEIYAQLGKNFDLEKITNDINVGRISVTELAYLVRGQKSGVEPVEPDTRTTKEKLQDGLELAKEKAAEIKEAAAEKIEAAKEHVAAAKEHVSQAWQAGKERLASITHHAPAPVSSSFVERTGRQYGPRGKNRPFTQMVDDQREQPALAGVSTVSGNR